MHPHEKGAHRMKKYTLEKEITSANIIEFYDDFSIGSLRPSYKSEPIPNIEENNNETIKVISFYFLKFCDEKEISWEEF